MNNKDVVNKIKLRKKKEIYLKEKEIFPFYF
jgi:hypothetical protein